MSGPDYLDKNQSEWDGKADEYAVMGEENWAADEVRWGVFGVPESEIGALPEIEDRDVLDLGCGTGYFSAWMARLGARPVGLDLSPRQLETARRLQKLHDLEFPLVRAAAEASPFVDESFDVILSEYGAAIWSDPYRWIPEASRLLRPGGTLVFLGNSALVLLCAKPLEIDPAENILMRPYFGMHRFEWPDTEGVNFNIGFGEWIRLFRANGFEVEDLIEVQAPEGAESPVSFFDAEWARQWPSEQIWRVRKR
ncbi:MAG: class I SAM-dependent methyltransferase [Acidimicrobiia bacterium]|nr:class I SAM-dependent methyltransferase [Acidimicrobiia bacterium]